MIDFDVYDVCEGDDLNLRDDCGGDVVIDVMIDVCGGVNVCGVGCVGDGGCGG